MSNMSYCRFENTVNDMDDCFDNLDVDTEEMSRYEKAAYIRFLQMVVYNADACKILLEANDG